MGNEPNWPSKNMKADCLDSVGALCALLYKLGIRKEQYMKGSLYHLGVMLSRANRLQACYSHVVRKSKPGELVGHTLFTTACENPQRCLTTLMRRTLPYVHWAQQAHGQLDGLDEKAAIATKEGIRAFALMGDAQTAMLAGGGPDVLPTSASDEDRFQISLGYLEPWPKSKSQEKDVDHE